MLCWSREPARWARLSKMEGDSCPAISGTENLLCEVRLRSESMIVLFGGGGGGNRSRYNHNRYTQRLSWGGWGRTDWNSPFYVFPLPTSREFPSMMTLYLFFLVLAVLVAISSTTTFSSESGMDTITASFPPSNPHRLPKQNPESSPPMTAMAGHTT